MIEGFTVYRGFGQDLDFNAIRSLISWEARTTRVYGREVAVPRLTAWYGSAPYRYSGIDHAVAALPPALEEIRGRLAELCCAPFNSVLANLYRTGRDSVGWHSDDEPELGAQPVIASLSLGATRCFAVRRRGETTRCGAWDLAHVDLVVMSGRSQLDFQHAVPKSLRLGGRAVGERINLTFRVTAAVRLAA